MNRVSLRVAIALYVHQLRREGIEEAEIQWRVEGASIQLKQEQRGLRRGEEIPVELYQSVSHLVKDVMKRGI